MDYTPLVRRRRFSGARLIVLGIILSILLLLAGLFSVLALPGWQIRLTGVQSTAIAHEDGICAGDSEHPGNSYTFTYEFTDTHGHRHRIAQHSFCTTVYNDGDHVTIWYMPNDPTQFVTDLQVTLLSIFSAIGSSIAIVLLIVFSKLFFGPLKS